MRTARFPVGASLGLLVFVCGCYHYAYSPYGTPYGGYGTGTYPVVPGDGGMGSSPTYIPYGGGTTGPGPTPINPNGNPPIDWKPGGNGGGSAPPYSPGSGGSSENPVPNPTDEEPFGGGAPSGASLTPGSDNISGSGIHLEPIETEPAAPHRLGSAVDRRCRRRSVRVADAHNVRRSQRHSPHGVSGHHVEPAESVRPRRQIHLVARHRRLRSAGPAPGSSCTARIRMRRMITAAP